MRSDMDSLSSKLEVQVRQLKKMWHPPVPAWNTWPRTEPWSPGRKNRDYKQETVPVPGGYLDSAQLTFPAWTAPPCHAVTTRLENSSEWG